MDNNNVDEDLLVYIYIYNIYIYTVSTKKKFT